MGMEFSLLFLLWLAVSWRACGWGVNWGREASHPLAPEAVVSMMKANNISRVRIFDAEAEVMESLSGSGLRVVVGIPNDMLKPLSLSKAAAESWVHDNVTRYSSRPGGVLIDYVAVGNEPFLQSHRGQYQPFVWGALSNIRAALVKANLATNAKVVFPCSEDVLVSSSGLPSKGQFRPDLNKTMLQILTFLERNKSPFVLNMNPYMRIYQNKSYPADYALFAPTAHPLKDGRNTYDNAFDASLDTLAAALSSLGFDGMDIIVGQLGWPTEGGLRNASTSSASTFMTGLIDHLSTMKGTPLRPLKPPLQVYIFSLLDEDRRSISSGNFERHWGVFTFDGQAKYQQNLGQGSRDLVNAQDVQYLSPRWCVVNDNKDMSNVSVNVQLACSVSDCTSLSPGGSCAEIGWPQNASYAFNSYYQMQNQAVNSCYFAGTGMITIVDPSVDGCRFTVALAESSAHHKLQPPWLDFLVVFALTIYSMR